MLPPDSLAPQGTSSAMMAYAPDGSAFAYSSSSGLVLRYSDRVDAVAVTGGRRGAEPFFSPDSRWFGFQDGPRVVRVPLGGGAPVTICDSCVGYLFHWGSDDTIRYHAAPPREVNTRVLYAVSARGGKPHIFARPDSGSGELFRSPTLLPGRRTVLFTIWKSGASRLAALDLRTGAITRFDQSGYAPHWVEPGFVVLANTDGALLALPFDADKVRVTGVPVTIVRDLLQTDPTTFWGAVSATGSVVYVQSGSITQRQLMLVSRAGQAVPLVAEPRAYASPRFSPDGRRVALDIVGENAAARDVWVLDVAQHAWSRLTTNGISERPVWTPDGRRLVYASNADLWWVASDGSGRPDSLLVANGNRYAGAVTPDGRSVIFQTSGGGADGIRSLAFDSAPASRTVIPAAFNESAPAISPDGRWLAYQSDEAGRMEVYVRPYPGAGARVPVSVQGGSEPVWSGDGRELFYRAGDSLMSASVALSPTFAVTGRRGLFSGTFLTGGQFREYDVAPDGQHFLMVRGGATRFSLITLHHVFDRLVYDRSRKP
jgi:serine/threonine-protein kinase